VAGFLAPWAEDILHITLGTTYAGGAATLMIMFFYPIHQSMGQVGGTMAYATGQVAVHVKISIVFFVSSIMVTYFVLAPPDAHLPGLSLGSLGLAGKMVVMQFLSVNALAFYLSRSLGIKFDWLFQPVTVMLTAIVGFFAYSLSQDIFLVDSVISQLAISGVIYFFLTAFILYQLPWLVGMTRFELISQVRSIFIIFR